MILVVSLDLRKATEHIGSELLATLQLRRALLAWADRHQEQAAHAVVLGKEIGFQVGAGSDGLDNLIQTIESATSPVGLTSQTAGAAYLADPWVDDMETSYFMCACAARWARRECRRLVDASDWLCQLTLDEPQTLDLLASHPPKAAESLAACRQVTERLETAVAAIADGGRVMLTDVHGISTGVRVDSQLAPPIIVGAPAGSPSPLAARAASLLQAQTRHEVRAAVREIANAKNETHIKLGNYFEKMTGVCRATGATYAVSGGDRFLAVDAMDMYTDCGLALVGGTWGFGLIAGVSSAPFEDGLVETFRRLEVGLEVTKICRGGPGGWGALFRWDRGVSKAQKAYLTQMVTSDSAARRRLERLLRLWPDIAEQLQISAIPTS